MSPAERDPPQGWVVVDRDGIAVFTRTFNFDNWSSALAFVNRVGALADAQDHHPLVQLSWGRVTLFCWSHDIKGLSSRDQRFCLGINELQGLSPNSQ